MVDNVARRAIGNQVPSTANVALIASQRCLDSVVQPFKVGRLRHKFGEGTSNCPNTIRGCGIKFFKKEA